MTAFRHIMRIGTHAEADFFRKLPQAFDMLMINANLLCGTPSASAAFIYSIKKPYIIDPFTHAFPLPPRFLRSKQKNKSATTAPKRTFVDLGSRYFPHIASFVGSRSIAITEIDAQELAANVLAYQRSWYLDIAKANGFLVEGETLAPALVIGPYFTMQHDLKWLDLNIACAEATVQIEQDAATVIAISMDLLRANASLVVKRYAESKIKTAFLWIESFDEDNASIEDLRCYCDFVRELSSSGVSPINLFGGFFSCIAADYGLDGFVHGLVYGENKAFTPVIGGGQPPPRYYFKPLHTAQNVLESQSLLISIDSKEYQAEVCDCAICNRVIGSSSPALAMSKFAEVNEQNKYTPTAYALCRFHFMLARRDEVTAFRRLSVSGKTDLLQKNINFLREIGASDLGEHLESWKRLVHEPLEPSQSRQ